MDAIRSQRRRERAWPRPSSARPRFPGRLSRIFSQTALFVTLLAVGFTAFGALCRRQPPQRFDTYRLNTGGNSQRVELDGQPWLGRSRQSRSWLALSRSSSISIATKAALRRADSKSAYLYEPKNLNCFVVLKMWIDVSPTLTTSTACGSVRGWEIFAIMTPRPSLTYSRLLQVAVTFPGHD